MTTNTTNSQAASIDTDPYFCKLLSRIAEFGFTGEHDKALVAHIDAKLAQARADALREAAQACMRTVAPWQAVRAIGDSAHHIADRDAILALLQPQVQADTK